MHACPVPVLVNPGSKVQIPVLQHDSRCLDSRYCNMWEDACGLTRAVMRLCNAWVAVLTLAEAFERPGTCFPLRPVLVKLLVEKL